MQYRVDFTINSDKYHPPITICVELPDAQAIILMTTPVTSVSISVSRPTIGEIAGLPMLDFKQI